MLRSLLKDTAIYGVGDFVFKFSAFMVFPVYAHVFSVEDFGVMALVVVTAALVNIFLNVGMNNSVQRFYWDKETEAADKSKIVTTGLVILLTSAVLLTVLVLSLLFPFSEQIEDRFEIPWECLLLALLANIPAQMTQYALDVLRLHFSAWLFTMLSALKNLLGVFIGLWLILISGQGLIGYFLGNLIGLIVVVPLALWLIRREVKFSFNRVWAKKLISYGYPFIYMGLAYWLFSSMDRWMLSVLSNNTEVGLYSIAFKFASVILFVSTAFGQAWSPFAIKVYSEKLDYREFFSEILTLWFYVLVVLGAGITLFASEILSMLTPEMYWSAAPIIGFAVMGSVLLGTTQITAIGISIEKKTKLFVRLSWITSVVNLILNFLLIPLFGGLGAAVATFISYGVLASLYLYWTQRLHPLPLNVKVLVAIFASIIVVLGLVFLLDHYVSGNFNSVLKLIIWIALIVPVFVWIKRRYFECLWKI